MPNDWKNLPKIDWETLPKVDFGIWPNRFKKSSKHPDKTGSIEVSEILLKGMLEQAKAGEMPVLSVAIWPRTSRNGEDYENAQLQLKPSKMAASEPKPEPIPEPKVENQTDAFDWSD
jgi:hypothetical protein